VDSGNVLYRARRYPEALVQYRRTVERSPDDVTGYFGVYMVAVATNDHALADSALVKLKSMGMTEPVGPHVPVARK
jgi:alkanesulfonate monooxygenase SsuD/methylene tetrahydromethanopterin reductase-like flavin-dependent oxidoreductase (luciferase family)